MENYVVQYGDTLLTIAQKQLGSSSRWQEIAKLNNIGPPYQLLVGQTIKLPAAGSLALTPPNGNNQPSIMMQPATDAWGRGFMFVVFEQLPAPGQKVVRKVAKVPYGFGLTAPNPLATSSLADHALGNTNTTSQFLSGSNKPMGAGSITGKPLLLDVAKIQAAGGTIHNPAEIIADLRRYAAANPSAARRVEQLIWAIDKVEGEVLIEGGVPKDAITRPSLAHTRYIRTAEQLWADFEKGKLTKAQLEIEMAALEKGYGKAQIIGRVGRVLTVAGLVFTAVDVADATQRSIDKGSFKPIAAETVRQVGGWGMAWAGAKIGAAGGALVGIKTGPGAIVTGAIGAIVFGALGYFGADFVADWIEEEQVDELKEEKRIVEAVKLTVGATETQYEFARRALIGAATLLGFSEEHSWGFADKFFPLKSPAEMAAFKMNWVSPDPSPQDTNAIKLDEFEKRRGQEFTFHLNPDQIAELKNMLVTLK